jgi:hypothetical protein
MLGGCDVTEEGEGKAEESVDGRRESGRFIGNVGRRWLPMGEEEREAMEPTHTHDYHLTVKCQLRRCASYYYTDTVLSAIQTRRLMLYCTGRYAHTWSTNQRGIVPAEDPIEREFTHSQGLSEARLSLSFVSVQCSKSRKP